VTSLAAALGIVRGHKSRNVPLDGKVSQTQEVQTSTSKAVLIVDRNHPGTVEFRAKTVKLTSKQFWLLAALAESPGKCVPYDLIYKRVGGDSAVVEMQQISYHKAQLLRKLSRVAPSGEVKSLVTAVSGEGLVLNLREEVLCGGN